VNNSTIDREARNAAFAKYKYRLHNCIARNLPLLKALRLDFEDVAQDLAVKMLRAIERFDSSRSDSLPLHIYCQLQFEILDMRCYYRPHGLAGILKGKRFRFISLDQPCDDGTVFDLPEPEKTGLYDLLDAINSLPSDERSTVLRKINGESIGKKVERETLERARSAITEYLYA
jgi:DNA-directed RNA polymerase specialized sigma24 family protein